MNRHYALLASVLLAACAPNNVSTSPPGSSGDQSGLNRIPSEFQGKWTYKQDGRHPPGAENPTVITATTWTGHETSGQVKSVQVIGDNHITVTLAMSGEGETWVEQNHLRLSPDGNVLTVTSPRDQSGWKLYRVR